MVISTKPYSSGFIVIDSRVMAISSSSFNLCYFCILLEITINKKAWRLKMAVEEVNTTHTCSQD